MQGLLYSPYSPEPVLIYCLSLTFLTYCSTEKKKPYFGVQFVFLINDMIHMKLN